MRLSPFALRKKHCFGGANCDNGDLFLLNEPRYRSLVAMAGPFERIEVGTTVAPLRLTAILHECVTRSRTLPIVHAPSRAPRRHASRWFSTMPDYFDPSSKPRCTFRHLLLEGLENRRLLAGDWQNSFYEFDVNHDGFLTPLDALHGINQLNSLTVVDSDGTLPPRSQFPDFETNPELGFWDTNGDGFFVPLDVLLLVNEINRGEEAISMGETGQFVREARRTVDVGFTPGSRTLRLEVKAQFDTTDQQSSVEDLLLMYLVDPTDPSRTLLDNGPSGSAFFSLAGGKAEFTPGLVSYDGQILTLDLTPVRSVSRGELVIQTINSDTDVGSRYLVRVLANETDNSGQEKDSLESDSSTVAHDPSQDLSALTAEELAEGLSRAADSQVTFSRIRYDSANNLYTAEVQVRNASHALGRNVAILFDDVPDGVQVVDARQDIPNSDIQYLGMRSAIGAGGLRRNELSAPMLIKIHNPDEIHFLIRPKVFSGVPNRAPEFEPLAPISLMPGGYMDVALMATDADGDQVSFALAGRAELPTGKLTADGHLIIAPRPNEIGTYRFDVLASDGATSIAQTVTLDVSEDPITSTRVSGVIQDTNRLPLEGVRVAVGTIEAFTDANGRFVLDFGDEPLPSDTLRIHAEELAGEKSYPYVAEKLGLVLEHEVFPNVDNVVGRPIYLPVLDTAQAETIDPAVDTTVGAALRSGEFPAEVTVKAGTLMDQSGGLFTGEMSITEVPANLTPAALPSNLLPDAVVTIQPANMVFTTPAPLTMPNRIGYPPDTVMDLWSINPATGEFDKVGTGRVRADGSSIDTTAGGIRNSSWHFFAPLVETIGNLLTNVFNPQQGCESCKAKTDFGSLVELHSGTVLETHELVTYQSLGVDRGLVLTYDSLRADPRHIVHFGYDNVQPDPDRRLVAEILVRRGDFEFQVPGFAGGEFGLDGGEHFWALPDSLSNIDAALQVDLRTQSSGEYEYALRTGLRRFNGEIFAGTSTESQGTLIHVNGRGSLFGNGWGISGLSRLVENPDGSVLRIDGDGSELIYEPPATPDEPFVSPPGDFSVLERTAGGEFLQTTKDQTKFVYDSENRLTLIRDRNGRESRFEYDAQSRLIKTIDPVGLETDIAYIPDGQGWFVDISDPAQRTTRLEIDSDGNLIQIVDPDGTFRQFEYDAGHRLISETDKLGNLEQTYYDDVGRAKRAVLGNGAQRHLEPAQVQGLFPASLTIDPFTAPTAIDLDAAVVQFFDAKGALTTTTLDQAQQQTDSHDSFGNLPSVERDENHLVLKSLDGRGNVTTFQYDSRGNVTQIEDALSFAGPIFVEAEGRVVVEAEHFSARSVADVHQFKVVPHEEPGHFPRLNARGGEYVQILPDANDFTDSPTIDYKVRISQPGTYQLYVRYSYHDPGSDSIFSEIVELKDGPGGSVADHYEHVTGGSRDFNAPVAWSGVGGFEANTAFPFESPAIWDITESGDYTVRFRMREDAAALDAFVLQLQSMDAPEGMGPAESTYVGGEPLIFPEPVFYDRFDSENGRVGTTNYSDFANWNVTRGSVDLLAPGFFELHPQGRINVDLDGSTNEGGRLETKQAFALEPGSYLLQFDLGGNRTSGIPNTVNVSVGDLYGEAFVREQFDPLETVLREIQVPESTNAKLVFDHADGDNSGAVLDNVRLTRLAGSEAPPSRRGADRFSYDPRFSQLTSHTDELGRQTLYDIDPANGNVRSITRVVGLPDHVSGETDDAVTRFTYTTAGLMDTRQDPLGRITDYDYDAHGRLTMETFAVGTSEEASVLYEYDLAGNVTAIVDENSGRTELLYDDLNQLIRLTAMDPDGAGPLHRPITEYQYDPSGNIIRITDSQGNATHYEYDVAGRPVRSTDANSATTTRTYDLAGNLIALSDELGQVTSFTYDARNRLVASTDPDGGRTEFEYDADNNLIARTDPGGNRTQYEYDGRNRLTREIDPLGMAFQRTYDATDNLIVQVDRNGRRTEFNYDELDRVVRESWKGTGNEIHYQYDVASNLLSVSDLFSTLSYAYDSRNRVRSVDNGGTPNAPEVVLTYTYDSVGNLLSTQELLAGIAAGNTTYSYDGLNRLQELRQSGLGTREKRADFEYNALGQFEKIERYSDFAGSQPVTESVFAYDAVDRLELLRHQNGTDVLSSYDLAYDAAGRIESIDSVSDTVHYTYDTLGQLTEADYSEASRADERYSYDDNGNRISSSRHGEQYTTDAANRLSSDGVYGYEYDGEGNLVVRTELANGSTRRFDWDHRNRLTAVTDRLSDGSPVQRVEYVYDALNRRVAKTVDMTPASTGDEVVTHYIYDGEDVLLDFVDRDGWGGPENATLSRRYLHGLAVDQVLAEEDVATGEVYWRLTDHQGTLRELVDHSGVVRNSLQVDATGNVVSQSSMDASSRYQFTGREYDPEIDLHYYRARYYSSSLGRFISEDPIRFDGQDQNLYRYTNNQYQGRVDPLGLRSGIVVNLAGEGEVKPLSVENGVTYVIDFQAGAAYMYIYTAAGGGIGTPVAASTTLEVGRAEFENPEDLAGFGLIFAATVASPGTGGAATAVIGTKGRILTCGKAIGTGGGVDVLLTLTKLAGKMPIAELPPKVLSAAQAARNAKVPTYRLQPPKVNPHAQGLVNTLWESVGFKLWR